MNQKDPEQYAILMAHLQEQRGWDAVHGAELAFLLEQTPPEVLGSQGCVLVCDSEEQQRAFRPLLDAMGLDYVGTRVAASPPAGQKWTPEMSAAKEAAARRLWRSGPAYTPPTNKARKAARRRAKAGRKANR